MLIEIGDIIVTDELFTQKFVCDIGSCHGACCIEGDDGAPLTMGEVEIMERLLPEVLPYMTEEGKQIVKNEGIYHLDEEKEPVTNLMKDGACAFVYYDEKGIAKCSFESAFRDGKTKWKKPISCELFPIRAKNFEQFTALNYQQIAICEPGRVFGEKLGVPLYQFLKEPITRAYGEDFFHQLEIVAKELENQNEGES